MTKPLYQNELEAKFKIENEAMKKTYIDRLLEQGFVLSANHLETDFVFDTEDDLCKKNKIILRYRAITGKEGYLLTMKVEQRNEHFQDYMEMDCKSDDYDFFEKLDEINRVLKKYTGKSLPATEMKIQSATEMITKAQRFGFTKNRMFSQKQRLVYQKDGMSVCFDILPKGFGEYIELEVFENDQLFSLIDFLDIKQNMFERRNYGKLIQDLMAKHEQSGEGRRICVFDSDFEKEIYLKFGLSR